VSNGEHVVDDFEALVLGGVIDGCDVRNLGVFCGRVVLEKRYDRDNSRGRDVDGQLVLPDCESSGVLARWCTMADVHNTYCWMYFGKHDSRYWPYL
jgi:hypothetical protein